MFEPNFKPKKGDTIEQFNGRQWVLFGTVANNNAGNYLCDCITTDGQKRIVNFDIESEFYITPKGDYHGT